jgi:hypothetical protein
VDQLLDSPQDNALAYKVLSAKRFLAQKLISEMEHPPSSPHLAPDDVWLFPKTRSALKGRRFQDTEDIQKECDNALEAIPQQEFQFQ